MINVDSEKKLIEITRGDTGRLVFSAKDENGNAYVPVADDVIRFAVAKEFGKEPLFEITHVMENDANDFWGFKIEPEHTKSLKFMDYVFDVEMTTAYGVDTIIGETDTIRPTFRVWGEI